MTIIVKTECGIMSVEISLICMGSQNVHGPRATSMILTNKCFIPAILLKELLMLLDSKATTIITEKTEGKK